MIASETIAFTLCSNNYFSQALTLANSITKFNKNIEIVIGLVDQKISNFDYKSLPYKVITIEEIGIPEIEELWKKYNIIELNTCVKAAFFKYLFRFPKTQYILYFDPDICVFKDVDLILNEFHPNFSILLTPHIFSPIPLNCENPKENLFLNFGIYNLGFIGIKRGEIANEFLEWWNYKTIHHGFIRVEEGYFVDQLWINLVPLFYDEVKIIKSLGYNVAPWNLHERNITFVEDKYLINSKEELFFYHFSSFKFNDPQFILFKGYSLNSNTSLVRLYNEYLERLRNNNYENYSKIECYYVKKHNEYYEKLYMDELRKNKYRFLKFQVKQLLKSLGI